MIDATGDVRSPLEVSDFMMSLGLQENINIVEPPPSPRVLLPGAFQIGPAHHDPVRNGTRLLDVMNDHPGNGGDRDRVGGRR